MRDEHLEAGKPHQLGQGGGVAEGVGKPDDLWRHPELVLVVFRALDDVAHEALARGDDDVRLEPERALDLEPAGLDLHPDALEEFGIVGLEIIEQHALVVHEAVVFIFVHQREGVGHGTGHLLSGLANAPEPGHVDMGVAGGDDFRHRIGVGLGVDGIGAFAGGVEACGEPLIVPNAEIDEIERGLDVAEHAGATRVIGFEQAGDVEGNLEIVIDDLGQPVVDDQFHRKAELPAIFDRAGFDEKVEFGPGTALWVMGNSRWLPSPPWAILPSRRTRSCGSLRPMTEPNCARTLPKMALPSRAGGMTRWPPNQ